MRRSIFLLSILLVLFNSTIIVAQDDTENHIEKIRKWYAEIEDQCKACKKIETGWNSGPNCTLTGYYDENCKQYIKLVISMSDDWYEATESYFLHDGKLFFIFEDGYNGGEFYEASELDLTDEEYWQQGREAKTLEYFQERKYFADGLCLRYLVKNKSIPVEERNEFNINNVPNEEKFVCEIFYDDLSQQVKEMIEALNLQK